MSVFREEEMKWEGNRVKGRKKKEKKKKKGRR